MDRHRIRRSILQALKELHPSAADYAELLAYPRIKQAGLLFADVAEAATGLIEHGYVENLRPGRTPLLRLTAAGRDQIDQETTLAEYVWGSLAL
jgi:hypothetical protein